MKMRKVSDVRDLTAGFAAAFGWDENAVATFDRLMESFDRYPYELAVSLLMAPLSQSGPLGGFAAVGVEKYR